MTSTQAATNGGQFLTSTAAPDDVFAREDLTRSSGCSADGGRVHATTKCCRSSTVSTAHDWELTRRLLEKASELDLLRLEIPAAYGGLGLDLVSASYVGEQIAVNPSFGGSLGAHTSIGTLPLVYFGTDEQKARYLPRLANAELVGGVRADRACSQDRMRWPLEPPRRWRRTAGTTS